MYTSNVKFNIAVTINGEIEIVARDMTHAVRFYDWIIDEIGTNGNHADVKNVSINVLDIDKGMSERQIANYLNSTRLVAAVNDSEEIIAYATAEKYEDCDFGMMFTVTPDGNCPDYPCKVIEYSYL